MVGTRNLHRIGAELERVRLEHHIVQLESSMAALRRRLAAEQESPELALILEDLRREARAVRARLARLRRGRR